jgi:hypothetical protein
MLANRSLIKLAIHFLAMSGRSLCAEASVEADFVDSIEGVFQIGRDKRHYFAFIPRSVLQLRLAERLEQRSLLE